eukprot:223183-Prorocentrum_minimum.AAC.1
MRHPRAFPECSPDANNCGEPPWPGRRRQNPPGGPRLGTTTATTAAGASISGAPPTWPLHAPVAGTSTTCR